MFSKEYELFHLASTINLDGSTTPVWGFTHGRLILDLNWIWGATWGYEEPQKIFRL